MAGIATVSSPTYSSGLGISWPSQVSDPGAPVFSDRRLAAKAGIDQATWSRPVIRRIRDLAWLKENWDSYGASTVRPESINSAIKVVQAISTFYGIDEPAVGATPDGFVTLVWSTKNWDVETEINEARIEYVLTYSSEELEQDSGRFRNPIDLANLLASLESHGVAA